MRMRWGIAAAILLLCVGSVGADRVELGTHVEDANVIVESSGNDRTVLTLEVGSFDKKAVEINGATYFTLSCGREARLLNEGAPALPHVARSIIIPDDAAIGIKVLSSEYTDYPETPVAPSKGNLLRTVNPEEVPYTFGEVYSEHAWYPGNVADVREPFIMRDYRGTVVDFSPFQYNPGTRTLRVYTSITVEVVVEGPGEINVLADSRRERPRVKDFDIMYAERFINYDYAKDRYTLVQEHGDMLIIAFDDFYDEMLPFMQWKLQKGIKTTMVNISTIGNNSTSIQNYIQDFYDSTNLVHVLLVGDAAQVATLSSGGGGADPLYALVAGSDHYPDILIGRFSSQTAADVETQVERTIVYERDSPGSDWFHMGTGIASNQGPGHNGGEYDNEHMDYIRDSLLSYTYTIVDQIYDPSGTSAQVAAALNAGRSIVNYCGHGSTTSWSTTGFSNTNVNALVNNNMLPFIFSVACVNGNFVSYTCFAEAWLRATNGGVPTGAIGTYMSSINQSWDPPMDAQDEFVHLIIQEMANTYGGLCYNASCKMMDLNIGSAGTSMYDTWHVFGDPSLQVRTDNPAPMTVNHPGAVFFNSPDYEVEVVGVQDALCAVYKDGVLYGSAYTNSGGIATIAFTQALPIGAPVTLTVTAYNKATVVEEVIVSTDLTIIHEPLPDTKETVLDYAVACTIYSDTTLDTDSLLLWYQVNSVWYSDLMETAKIGEDFVGYIPAQAPGTVIDYYIFAKNLAGFVDSTDLFTFRVIDYGVLLDPDFASQKAPVDDTVWYDLTVTNDGVLDDSYALAWSGNAWDVALWDETGTTPVSATTTLAANETFDFKISVIIPTSWEDEYDTVLVNATSVGNGAYADASVLQTISAGEPWQIPFGDDFPSTTLNTYKWEVGYGVEINDLGINEPSAAYSADFNGDPSGGDTLMSETIDLRDHVNVVFSYAYQQTGDGDSPETDDDLYVEYLDSLGGWHLLQQHFGSDPDMTEFQEVSLTLPAAAYHSSFRVRFRNHATSGTYDDWFVDDVYIGYPPDFDLAVTPGFQSQYGPAGDTAAYLVTIVNLGLLSDAYDLTQQSGDWDVAFSDESGAVAWSSTPMVAAGDSVKVMVKVAVPTSAPVHDVDSTVVRITSQGEDTLLATVAMATYSGGLPVGFPLYEPFATTTISTDIWFSNDGAEVSLEGIAPPSSPYCLNLDGASDTLVSRMVDISDQNGAILSYYFQRGGSGEPPDIGENLWIDYKNVYGDWVNISTHLGDATSMTTFEYVNLALPPDAIHSGFQLRLHSVGSAVNNDDWYIDDIRIDYAPEILVTPASCVEWLGADDSMTTNLIITNTGPGGLHYNLSIQQVLKDRYFTSLAAAGRVQPATADYPEGTLPAVDEKGVDYPNLGLAVTRDAGGPDLYGYYWVDSDEPSGPTFDWIDVSSTGVDLVDGFVDDTALGPYSLGFMFPFYGNYYDQIYIGSNGIVGFSSTNMRSRLKTPLPDTETPNNIIAWLWDDLNNEDSDNPGAHVYFDTTGGRCVIQFVDYPEYAAGPGEVITAEVILEEDGTIKMQYLSIATGFDIASGTVGIENASGTDGLQVAYATEYLHDSLAVVFTKPQEWLTLSKFTGEVASGGADTIVCQLSSAGMDSGTFNANVIVASNDPDPADNPLMVPFELTVSADPPYVCGDVNADGTGPDVGDLVYWVDWAFGSGPEPINMAALNVDGAGGALPDIADLTYLVDYMFSGGPDLQCGP